MSFVRRSSQLPDPRVARLDLLPLGESADTHCAGGHAAFAQLFYVIAAD
jgi:hypothetical protein